MKVFTFNADGRNRSTLLRLLFLPLLLFVGLMSSTTQAQTRLAAWSFPTEAAAPNTPTTFPAEFGEQVGTAMIYLNGTNGSSTFIGATGATNELTMFAGSTINDPKTTSSNTSAVTVVNTTANGKGFVLKLSMTGYENPVLTYATRGTATGFTTQTWSVSTDGVSFTNVSTITGRNNTSYSLQTVNLSSRNELDNASTIYLKVSVSGGTNASGNNRFDNFQIYATAAAVVNIPVVTPEFFMGMVGANESYQVEATENPEEYSVASGDLPTGLTLNTTTGEISGVPTEAGYFTVDITATNSAGTSDPATFEWVIDPGDQTITFGALSNVTYGDAPFNLTGTASSGLTVSYNSSNPLVASVSGNTVTIVGAGTTTITAFQLGDANWNSASSVQQTLTVDKADQTITFDPIDPKLTTDPDFNLNASASSGLTVSYSSSDPGVVSISGNTVTINGVGTATITASQSGNSNYNAATSVTQDVVVTDASLLNQTITFDPLSNVTYGDAPFNLSATASSSLTVSYSSDDDDVATVSGNTVTIHGVGTVTITASQAGDASYNPAADVTQSLTVDPKNLTVSGLAVEDKVYDGTTSATLDFTNASLVGVVGSDDVSISGTATFNSADAGVVAVTTNLSLTGTDSDKYTLSQPSISGNILQASQTITFNALASVPVDAAPFNLSATSTSGLTVSYVSSNPSVATVSGNTVTLVGVGTTTITASQVGNTNYSAATPVDQVLTVVAAPVNVTWNFGTASANGAPANVPSGISISDMVNANSLGTDLYLTNSVSGSYPGASGQFNIALAAPTGALNQSTSGYFVFTITPDAGKEVTLTGISLGSRSTSTGPQALVVKSSADNYDAVLATSTMNNNSAWAFHDKTMSLTFSGAPVTIRIYGYNGTSTAGTAANWRVDDVTIKVIVSDLPGCEVETPVAGTAALQGLSSFCSEGSADITLSGTGAGLDIQWYSSTNNVDFTPIAGEISDVLSIDGFTETTYFYAVATCSVSEESDISNTITVTVLPAPVATISGNLEFCAASSTTLTSSVGDSYQWNDVNGPIGGATNASLLVTTPGSYSVTVTTNGCSATSDPVVAVTVGAPVAPVIIGVANVCKYLGTSEEIEFTVENPIPGATYNWTVPVQANLISGQGTPIIRFTVNAQLANTSQKQVRVTVTTACGTSPVASFSMKTQEPTTPKPIEGPVYVCTYIGNATLATYSVPPVEAASSYLWIVPTGVTIVNNNGNSIDVTFDNAFQTDNILVYAINGCGFNSPRSMSLVRTVPSAPSPVAGPTNVCALMPTAMNPAGINGVYSVTATAGNTYTWTLPSGATLVNQWMDADFAYAEVAFSGAYTTGNISVNVENGCGVSAERILKLSKLSPSAPGLIDQVETAVCPDRIITYTLSSMPGGALFTEWTVPAGATILSGQGTTSISVSYPSTAVSGEVTVRGVNGCSVSSVRKLKVKMAACAENEPDLYTKLAPSAETNLNANIYPNPSSDVFRLKVEASSFEKVTVSIYDITGRAQRKSVVRPGETVTIGEGLKTGTYFVELIQGKQRKVVKVVKL